MTVFSISLLIAFYLCFCLLSLLLFYPFLLGFIALIETFLETFDKYPWVDFIRSLLHSIPGSVYAHYTIVLAWRPILVLVALPFLFVALLYISAFLIYFIRFTPWIAYKFSLLRDEHRLTRLKKLQGPMGATINVTLPSLDLVSHLIATLWDIHGRIFHGYEILGLENLDPSKPALIIYYHGTVPLDIYHFVSRYIITKDFCPTPVVDNFMLKVPGIQNIIKITGATSGTVEDCVKMLKQRPQCMGHAPLIMIGPGGLREALFSDEYYNTLWGSRTGFARVASKANCPIYPMFTENIREPIRPIQLGKTFWRWLYEITRLPLHILYGYFPVKLRTHIGKPIYPKLNEDPQNLADRVNSSINNLISQHQQLPGNIILALAQRIPIFDKWLINRCKKKHLS